jgi:hypothetical protein
MRWLTARAIARDNGAALFGLAASRPPRAAGE